MSTLKTNNDKEYISISPNINNINKSKLFGLDEMSIGDHKKNPLKKEFVNYENIKSVIEYVTKHE